MIPYIDERMREWAEWSRMRIDGFYGLGGGGFHYDEPMPSHEIGYVTQPSSLRCLQSEEAVAWLCKDHRTLGRVVMLHYRDRPYWSAAIRAESMRMNVRTYWRRLETSHAQLLAYFFDRAYGLIPQTEQLRLARRTLIA